MACYVHGISIPENVYTEICRDVADSVQKEIMEELSLELAGIATMASHLDDDDCVRFERRLSRIAKILNVNEENYRRIVYGE